MLGFALASLLLTLGFGYLIYKQQHDMLYQSSREGASSLAHALSISGTSWVLANDLVGLQEVVQGFTRTVDLQRAYFLSERGEVLASTNPQEIGYFVKDKVSLDMLRSSARDQIVLIDQSHLVVVAHPVLSGGRLLGWVRVEMTRDSIRANLAALTWAWGAFIAIAVLVVSGVAMMLASGLTQGLNHLMGVATEVERGREELRSDIGRDDEIGVLARHLNRMLDAIEHQKGLRGMAENALQESHDDLQLLLDSMAEGAYGVDVQGCCTFVNRSFLHLLGYQSANEVLGRHIHDLIHHTRADGSPYPDAECKMYLAFRNRQLVNIDDEVFWRKDGSSFPVSYSSFPIVKHGEVTGAIATFADISERKKTEEKIRNLAFYDTLTKLPNRYLLHDRLGQAMFASHRSGRYGALMFIDLDNFKPLNDRHGHDAGDRLLAEAARRLSLCVRESDTVARFGGDEFVVILSELSKDRSDSYAQAEAVAEKIRVQLAEPYTLSVNHQDEMPPVNVEHRCTSSIGVVLFSRYIYHQDEILKWADIAMYQAKESGRNQVRFIDAEAHGMPPSPHEKI